MNNLLRAISKTNIRVSLKNLIVKEGDYPVSDLQATLHSFGFTAKAKAVKQAPHSE